MAMNIQNGADRTPVAFFHIVDSKGADLGWLGYCEKIAEAMLPAILHPGGVDAAEQRSRNDPPAVISTYAGDVYVPITWLRKSLTEERDLKITALMAMAAESAWKESAKVSGA